jgi:hypothetical protein
MRYLLVDCRVFRSCLKVLSRRACRICIVSSLSAMVVQVWTRGGLVDVGTSEQTNLMQQRSCLQRGEWFEFRKITLSRTTYLRQCVIECDTIFSALLDSICLLSSPWTDGYRTMPSLPIITSFKKLPHMTGKQYLALLQLVSLALQNGEDILSKRHTQVIMAF